MKNKIPKDVLRALNHVRQHYPDVCLVVFNSDTRWQYMNDVFKAPKFGKEIDSSILEDAVQNLTKFPCVYELNE